MEPEELRKRFATQKLARQIPGQRLHPDAYLISFEYGALEDVPAALRFKFAYCFGGFSGWRLQVPPEGFAWIKSCGSDLFWEVRKQDLAGNYSEVILNDILTEREGPT